MLSWQTIKARPRLLLLIAIAINLVAATAPFRLDLPVLVQNRLQAADDGTLTFRPPSIARTAAAPVWLEDAVKAGEITLDLTVTPGATEQAGPARILAISKDYLSHNLMVGQDKSDLLIRLRRPGSAADGQPAFVIPQVFTAGRASELHIQIGSGRLYVEVNEKTALNRALPAHSLQEWDSGFTLALGNEVTGLRGWNGTISRAVIETPLHRDDLLTGGSLNMQQSWWQIPPRLRVPFEFAFPEDALAALLHLIAFVPIGFALFKFYGGRAAWPFWIIIVLAIAAGMEAAKILVEGRHPSALNLIANAGGGLIGAHFLPRWIGARGAETQSGDEA